jgi:hypothetical protein
MPTIPLYRRDGVRMLKVDASLERIPLFLCADVSLPIYINS